MNYNEVEKHVFFQIFYIIFIIVTMVFTIFYLLTDSVSAASDYHNVVTNAVYTGTTHCSTNQVGICVSDTSSVNYSRYTFGTTSYQNTLSMNFWLNTTVRKNVNATIRLTGSYWANVPYTCQTNYFTDCRVVRANSSILNINFSNPDNAVSGVEFFITANGSILNTNDTFYVQKADLYETNFVDEESQNTQDLINNQNQNTEDIINNNNQNTQDIIQQVQYLLENDEELNQKLIDAQSCPVGPLAIVRDDWVYINNKYLNSSGEQITSSGYGISPYIDIKPSTEYKLTLSGGFNAPSVCFYKQKSTSSNSLISCSNYAGRTSFSITSPSNAEYMLVSFNITGGVTIKGPVCNDWQKEAQDKMNNILGDTNSFLQDNSDPNINNSAISDTLESVAIDDPLNYLLTLPLHTIQRINYQLGRNTCSQINLGSLYGTDLILPCINIEQKIGSSLFATIDILMAIGIGSVTLKKFYDSVSNVLTLGKEKEVREKLELPTPMEFFAMIFGGGR